MTDESDSEIEGRRPSLDAREIARRNRAVCGDRLSPVLKTAATACELAEAPPGQRRSSRRDKTG